MNHKLATDIIFALTSAGLASAHAAPPNQAAKPAPQATADVSHEQRAIFATMAKLSLLLAAQTERTTVNGRTQSETRPGGIVGTYLYEGDGRLRGITYSDGRAITVMYDVDGNIASMLDNGTGRKIVFKRKATSPNGKDKALAAAFAIEKGIMVLIERMDTGRTDQICEETSPFPCVAETPAAGGG